MVLLASGVYKAPTPLDHVRAWHTVTIGLQEVRHVDFPNYLAGIPRFYTKFSRATAHPEV